jgi:hypothetical protein
MKPKVSKVPSLGWVAEIGEVQVICASWQVAISRALSYEDSIYVKDKAVQR